jgi:hypothetical protein
MRTQQADARKTKKQLSKGMPFDSHFGINQQQQNS